MKTQPSKERAESRVVNRYHKLYVPLIELIDALQDLEPGGMLVDNVKIGKSEADKTVRVEYSAHPIILTIKDGNRAFILRIAETNK
jgi:hypothetical protein